MIFFCIIYIVLIKKHLLGLENIRCLHKSILFVSLLVQYTFLYLLGNVGNIWIFSSRWLRYLPFIIYVQIRTTSCARVLQLLSKEEGSNRERIKIFGQCYIFSFFGKNLNSHFTTPTLQKDNDKQIFLVQTDSSRTTSLHEYICSLLNERT